MTTTPEIAKIYSVEDIELGIIKTNPPQLYIRATGMAPTSGWKNPMLSEYVYIQPPPDGIWDFDFLAERPTGIVLQVLTRVYAEYIWTGDLKQLKGVRIHASSNAKEKLLREVKEFIPSESRRSVTFDLMDTGVLS